MRDLLIILIVFTAVPITLSRPYVGFMVWVWLALMNPHRLAWGYATELRLSLVLGVAIFIGWLISRERKLPPPSPIVWLLAIFTGWVSLTTVFSVVPDEAFVKWQSVIKILSMTFLLMCLITSRERINALIWICALSLGYFGLKGGVFSLVTGGVYRVWGPPASFIADNNALALALVMTLPLMRYLQGESKQALIKLGMYGLLGLTVVAVVGTYSRGGLLGLAVIMPILWYKSQHRAFSAVLFLIAAVIGLLWLPDQWFDRMATIGTYERDASAIGRLQAWKFGLGVALQHPVLGGGFRVFEDAGLYRMFVPEASGIRNFHSIYFEVLAENGFVGLGLFLALGGVALARCVAVIRMARLSPELDWAGNLARMLQTSIIGYAVAGAFQNLGFFDFYYMLLALVVGLEFVVRNELSRLTGVPFAERQRGAMSEFPRPAPATPTV